MKILIDTNVILDVLIDRKDFAEPAQKIFKLCEVKKVEGFISALSIPNIVYIMRKELDRDKIKNILNKLTLIFNVADLKSDDLITASEMDFNDYEDAVHCAQAMRIKADYIVTRNVKDFDKSKIPVITPQEFIKIIKPLV